MIPNTARSFWVRAGCQDKDAQACVRAVQGQYANRRVTVFQEQGYCSFTFLIDPEYQDPDNNENGHSQDIDAVRAGDDASLLVQIRPRQYALNLELTHAACESYPDLTARTRLLSLELPENLVSYEMERLRGVPLSRVLPRHRLLCNEESIKLRCLITAFAEIIARSWHPASEIQTFQSRHMRADSPMATEPDMLARCTGPVGSSIKQRLRKLAVQLPDAKLRRRAASVEQYLEAMDDYPVVFTHGDFIPTNILVSPSTWEITGLVDWAEAEFLPFGVCLYGLELLLGYLDHETIPKFVYYDDATQYRALFWSHLLEARPGMEKRITQVEMMRDLGVLLWYGIAWDDGALDRVVNEVDDVEVLACLRAFFAVV